MALTEEEITYSYAYTCDAPECPGADGSGRAVARVARSIALDKRPQPELPAGWTELRGKTYCPEHEVVAQVRTKERQP